MKKIFFALFITIAFVLFLFFNYIKNYDISLANKHYFANHVENPLNAAIGDYKNIAELVYSVEVNKDTVTQYLYRASKTDDKMLQKKERDALYTKLSPLYAHLKKLGIKQLHFHFKDARSFLRFHKPSKFGDSLANIRETIVYANRHQTFVEGFEEGRIFNGYRFVYPLYYKGEHTGSVEISIGFSSLAKILNKSFATQTYMMLRDNVVEHKVFSDQKRNYSPSYISKHFYHESNTYDNIDKFTKSSSIFTTKLVEDIFQKYNEKVDKKLLTHQKFFFYDKIDNINYVLYFKPIKNFKKENIGYILFLNESNIFANIYRNFLYRIISSITLLFLVLLFTYYLIRKNRAIALSEKKALRAAQAKSDFLANMSHEIRTPLNAIFGYLHLLHKEIKDGKAKEYITIIESSSETLLNVINDILDFSKLESKKLELSPITFNAPLEFENIYKMFLPLAQKKEIHLLFNCSKNVPIYLEGDVLRLNK